jgi:predicted DNA-binding transcriptional regulator AlpA
MSIVSKQPDWVERYDPTTVIQVGDIVSREEIASRLGVSRATVYGWTNDRKKTGFPEPMYGQEQLGGGSPVYHYPTVMKFYNDYTRNKPKGGAPRKKEWTE